MIHYILTKYQAGYLTDEQFQELASSFHKVAKHIDGISSCTVKRNIVVRDTNMDVMVSFHFDSPDLLGTYLKHPLHLEIAEKNDPYIIQRVSFDCE